MRLGITMHEDSSCYLRQVSRALRWIISCLKRSRQWQSFNIMVHWEPRRLSLFCVAWRLLTRAKVPEESECLIVMPFQQNQSPSHPLALYSAEALHHELLFQMIWSARFTNASPLQYKPTPPTHPSLPTLPKQSIPLPAPTFTVNNHKLFWHQFALFVIAH